MIKLEEVKVSYTLDGTGECNIVDDGKRVLLSPLFDFDFRDFRVQRCKHSTHMSPKSKSKRGERRTRLQQSAVPKEREVI
jgi:hypothetical protein